ncbi:NAD(P)H-dependent flavin oxidoreductase [Roseovarius pelagicus]|uniref:Propionate 3-nitronate monooxygenase n=1 Tax=Roseovarius pelagicus TaxID=2980108 RepID=A0ABY6DBG1_9RHOB|nr:nitronate monooxygenase [Roseovarius pelagicus]UXX83489.1 nitronate monooxygenase [Roseovarius pelagicus]
MWPDNRLIDLLDIEHPIILAPMAGTTTPALAAAVSNAGGLGSHGCATMPLDTLRAHIREIAAQTNRGVNLNFFCHVAPEMTQEHHNQLLDVLAPYYAAAGVSAPDTMPQAPYTPFGPEHLAILLEHPPAVASFHFGLPEADAIASLKAAGTRILSSATTVAEAKWLAARNVDAIIAQGWEAGGHRGVFLDVENDAQIGLLALVPQIASAVDVPVIAAGGIADGRGIAAAFALGASGVQIGTGFLTSDESAPKAHHFESTDGGSDDSTRISCSVSGRPARAHRTAWLNAMAQVAAAPFPLMYHYTRPLLAADSATHHFSLYGQSAALAPSGPAANRLAWFVEEAQRAFERISR